MAVGVGKACSRMHSWAGLATACHACSGSCRERAVKHMEENKRELAVVPPGKSEQVKTHMHSSARAQGNREQGCMGACREDAWHAQNTSHSRLGYSKYHCPPLVPLIRAVAISLFS